MRRALALVVALVLVGLPAPASVAAPPQNPAEAQARAAFDRGEAALQAGRLEEAIAAFREVVAAYPDDPGVRFRLGQALMLAGEPEAIEHLERARNATADRPEVVFLLAQAYLANGRYPEAAEALAVVDAVAPGVPDVQLARGELCYLTGRLEGARRFLARAADLGPPGWVPPLYRLGLALIAAREWSAAAEWLERATVAKPEDPELWMLLGTARNRAGDPTGAIYAFERAVQAAPESVTARLVLAERYDFADEVALLTEQVEAILELDPDNTTALMHRANRAALDGRDAEALADLQRLLAADAREDAPRATVAASQRRTSRELRAEAQRRRIELLQRAGRLEEALAAAQTLVAEEPSFADGWFVLGNLLLRQGDAAGRDHLERFKAMSDARNHRRLGESFLETSDDPTLAEAELEAALAAWPEDRRAMLGLARVRRAQGRHGEAWTLLEQARGAPGTAETWFAEVIRTLAASGRADEARAAWKQASEAGMALGPEVGDVLYEGDFGCR